MCSEVIRPLIPGRSQRRCSAKQRDIETKVWNTEDWWDSRHWSKIIHPCTTTDRRASSIDQHSEVNDTQHKSNSTSTSITHTRTVRPPVRFEDYVWAFKLIKDTEHGTEHWTLLFVVMYDFGLHYSDGLKKKKKKGEMLQYTCIASSVSIKNYTWYVHCVKHKQMVIVVQWYRYRHTRK